MTLTRVIKIRECCGQDQLSVNSQEAVLRGVKILGLESANRRQYTAAALQRAVPLYEGVKVNIDHPEGNPQATRGLRDRFGKMIDVHLDGDGLRGDLAYNPAHPLARAVAWWAAHQPDCLGLSHNAVGQGKDHNGVFVVEKIVAVRSVDLVADPASTRSLYEDTMDDAGTYGAPASDTATPSSQEKDHEDHLIDAVTAVLRDDRLSKAEKRTKVLKILGLLGNDEDEDADVLNAAADDSGDDDNDDTSATTQDQDAEESLHALHHSSDPHVRRLLEQLDRYRIKARLAARRRHVQRLCAQARLPAILLTNVFLEQLLRAPDERTLRALIEDRRRLSNMRKPRSAGPGVMYRMDVNEFARQLS